MDEIKKENDYSRTFNELFRSELKRGNLTEAFKHASMGVATKTPEERIQRRDFYIKK